MELMREHTFKESDLNEDRLISREEFLKETKREEFEKDPGWDTIDSNEGADITDEEFKAYQEKRQKEIEERLKDEKHPPGSVNDGSDVPAVVQPGIEQNQAELEIDENDKEVSNNGDGKGGAESVNQDQLPPVPQPNPPQPEEPEVNLAHGL